MSSVTTKGVPYPLGTDPAASLDTIIQALAEWVNARPGIASLTTSERDELSGSNLWVGRVIFNNQTERMEVYTGSSWSGDAAAAGTNSIIDLAVTTAKLAAGAVTLAKIAAAAYASAPTPDTLVKRDAAGRTQVVSPAAASDAANKAYVDASGASTATPSSIMRRDSSGRVQVVAPSASADVATKGYVDGKTLGATKVEDAPGGLITGGADWNIEYRKIGDMVFVWGQAGTAGSSSPSNLPDGWRPVTTVRTPCTNGISGYGTVTINTDGLLTNSTGSAAGGRYFTAVYRVTTP